MASTVSSSGLQLARKPVSRNNYHHLIYLPKRLQEALESGISSDERWPLLIFMHGAGEKTRRPGQDFQRLKMHGIPKIVESLHKEGSKMEDRFPFIAVSPHCPVQEYWEPTLIKELVCAVSNEYKDHVDKSRIYCTGLSMGGYGTWEAAIKYPHLFAAIAPICGGGKSANVHRISHLPVWAFHGDSDDIVPLSESVQMVRALEKCKGTGEVKFTVYPAVKHDSWTQTYENPQLYEWLLRHTNPSPMQEDEE